MDDIVFSVLPKLKNGTQPNKQKIIAEIKKIAAPVDNKYWALQAGSQQEFQFESKSISKRQMYIPPFRQDDAYNHNELIYALAMIGRSAGFECYIGKHEQTQSWDGELLANLVSASLDFAQGSGKFTRDKIEQIDLMWFDGGRPVMAFEIEHTTSITTGLDRFIELLRAEHEIATKAIIVLPYSRRKKLDQILESSHYIGAPMYIDKKIKYLWYSDISALARNLVVQSASKSSALEAVLRLAHSPDSAK